MYTKLKTFKTESEGTVLFNLTYGKAMFILGGLALGMKFGEQVSTYGGFFLGVVFALVAFFLHNLFRRLFPGKRFESMTRFFFMQADIYRAKQDKKYIPVVFVDDE
jgi:hypothetical protein